MKLTDFDKKQYAPKALAETYNVNLDFDKLSKNKTQAMLQRVRTLATEMKESRDFYAKASSPEYMKLVFMEQALVEHYNVLMKQPKTRIVVENEEVEKSQVVLAAQDMVDSVQKMIEDVSDMMVKELPALVDSIQSEIGASESEQFNAQVTEALSSLQAALAQSQTTLKSALNSITGQGAGDFDTGLAGGPEMGGELGGELDGEMGDDLGALPDDEMGGEIEADAEIEEPTAPVADVGRAKR